MPATLDHEPPTVLVIPEPASSSVDDVSEEYDLGASYTTLLAFAIATTLLLVVILGAWWVGGPLAAG